MSKVSDFFARGTRQAAAPPSGPARVADVIRGFPSGATRRPAAHIDRVAGLLRRGTGVYVAHIDGTPIEDMVETARRIAAEGLGVMAHSPARSIRS